METNSNKSSINIIGGCLFAVLAIRQLYITIYNGYATKYFMGGSIWSVLKIVAFAIIAVALFAKIKSPLSSVGFVILTMVTVHMISQNYKYGRYLSHLRIDYFRMLPELFVIVAYIIAALMIVMLFMADESRKEFVRKCWFIPAVVYVISSIFSIILIVRASAASIFPLQRANFWDIVIIAGLLFSMLWMAYPDGMAKKTITLADGTVTEVAASEEDGYQGLAVHVLLLLCTCGIWYLIWIYKTTAYLNCVEDEEPRNPATKLLLCMFVPFYSIYWVYKSAQRIDKMANARGIQSDLSAVCLILAIFIGIIPPILMQDKINAIATAKKVQGAF